MALDARIFTYEAELEWRGGRHAEVTSGSRPALAVMPPPDFPAGNEASWSPEHLFLASLQSCTMLSFVAHCAHNGLDVRMAGGHATAARDLTEKAQRDCFISASTTADVSTDWRIIE